MSNGALPGDGLRTALKTVDPHISFLNVDVLKNHCIALNFDILIFLKGLLRELAAIASGNYF